MELLLEMDNFLKCCFLCCPNPAHSRCKISSFCYDLSNERCRRTISSDTFYFFCANTTVCTYRVFFKTDQLRKHDWIYYKVSFFQIHYIILLNNTDEVLSHFGRFANFQPRIKRFFLQVNLSISLGFAWS